MIASNLKTNSAEIVATLRDVTVTYDGYQTRALVHVNLDVRSGEVVGVLGTKGAGKSTMLKILAGRLRPTEGAAKVFGRSPRRGSAKARVGFLPGKIDANRPRGFFGRLFGGKNELLSAGRGITRLAQAMVGNRDLLVLDDPFEGLEPTEISEAKTLIRDMIARGKTVVLSSESLVDIKELCQRFVIVHEGKVQATGTLAELLAAGGAIRFLPAVLPREIVERVLNVLREEVIGKSIPVQTTAPAVVANSSSVPPMVPKKGATAVPYADQLLNPLTKPVEGAQPAPAAPQTADPIDHGKLEQLTKSKP
ncbi:MAG TPA: ATP-binding cassette domain-containing protein [Verrucomicrobiae bacterium]|jgi:ABC-2 type transport system ATP-binding protein|nr:ATP-binding cassette domain-containing protein [Verrucomicrobiae bacterium]